MSSVRDRLTGAADRLDRLAAAAEYREGRWLVDVAGPVADTGWLGPTHDVLTAIWPQAELVNVFSPALARILAGWLRAEAQDVQMCDRINEKDPYNDGGTRVLYRPQVSDALKLADHVLKETP